MQLSDTPDVRLEQPAAAAQHHAPHRRRRRRRVDPPSRGSAHGPAGRWCPCGPDRRQGHRSAGACPRGPEGHARALRGRDLRRRDARLPRAADGCSDGPAPVRRLAGGLDDLDALLPGGSARRLRLCACIDAAARSLAPAARSRGRARAGGRRTADRPRARAASRGRVAVAVAARRARARSRCALLRRDDREPPAPALAGDERAHRRPRSVLPLRRRKRGQPDRAARVPVRRRAAADARSAGTALVDRLRVLRAALSRLPGRRTARRRSWRSRLPPARTCLPSPGGHERGGLGPHSSRRA